MSNSKFDEEAVRRGADALRTAYGEDLVPCQAMNFALAAELVLDAALADGVISEKRGAINALRQAAKDWDNDYEWLTATHGSYGQTKVRAGLRLAETLARRRADELEAGSPHRSFGRPETN